MGHCKRCTRVSDGDCDEIHPPPTLLEGGDEEEVFIGLISVFIVASEISGESNLKENECAQFLVEGSQSGVRYGRDASSVNEVRRCAVVPLEESLCLFLLVAPMRVSDKVPPYTRHRSLRH